MSETKTPGQEMRDRLEHWAVWYKYHAKEINKSEDLKNIAEFYMKAIDGLFEVNAFAVDAIIQLELGKEVRLLVPKGVKLHSKIGV